MLKNTGENYINMKKILLACALLASCSLLATSCNNTPTVNPDDDPSVNPGGDDNNPGDDDEEPESFDTSRNVNLYSREAGSGTRECFFEGIGYGDVAKEDKWEDGVVVVSPTSNGDMMSQVGSDPYGIGYCSLDGIGGNTSIKALSYEGVTPTEDTVIDGSYALQRNFNYVIRDYENTTVENGENRSAVAHAFIEFFNTIEGQTQIASAGGIVTTAATGTLEELIEKYPVLSGNETVQLYTCGSTSVEKVLSACINYFTGNIPNKNITISASQTGSGAAVTGITEGNSGTLADIGFLSREINDEELAKLTDNNIHSSMCVDAVVAIVNAENTAVSDITGETLTSIYKGELKTWADVVNAL